MFFLYIWISVLNAICRWHQFIHLLCGNGIILPVLKIYPPELACPDVLWSGS
uniref:Uncharacterized protein n=1 Tax=Arundo donax TaxID=35708 RepID=A0A0A9C3C6_ARUDO